MDKGNGNAYGRNRTGARKVYVQESSVPVIAEAEWAFHFGQGHDGRPYVSDSKYRMAGRETGHFGSGTYFSTYPDNGELDQYRTESGNPSFIQVGDRVYRVDMGLYGNLYRVRGKKQGDVLYTMLRDVNRLMSRIAYMGNFSRKEASYSNADLYQRIRSNAEGLGLKCPSYLELTRMAQRLGTDKEDARSLSTVFMEYNGYNGVNVSGVDYYDNTKHGSVIYDLSKVGGKMEEVRPRSLYTGMKDKGYGDSVVQGMFGDHEMGALNGGYVDWEEVGRLPLSRALRVLRNHIDGGNVLDPWQVRKLSPELRKRYLRLLFVRNPKDTWGDRLCDQLVEDDGFVNLIEETGAYYWVNYEGRKRYSSVLVRLLSEFMWHMGWDLSPKEEDRAKRGYLGKLKSYLKRELTDYERRYIEEDYLEG